MTGKSGGNSGGGKSGGGSGGKGGSGGSGNSGGGKGSGGWPSTTGGKSGGGRNNAETGNHAFKAILGDQIYSKSAQAQRCEILCMCIAYNLTRLVLLEAERGVAVDYTEGVARLSISTSGATA